MRYLTSVLFSIFYFLFTPLVTQAASLYFTTPEFSQSLYAPFEMEVRLDSPDQAINAVDGTVEFGPGTVELVDVSDGSSIINLWLEKPTPPSRAVELPYNSATVVRFAGIIPGGFQGTSGKLFSMVFAPQAVGEIHVSFGSGTIAYLNGPDGQPARLQLADNSLVIQSEKLPVSGVASSDLNSPESFTPELVRNPQLYNGQWALVFVTADKQSGISHYAVWERSTSLWQRLFGSPRWVTATSPYLLKDQQVRHLLYVKAVDRAGNERWEILRPTKTRLNTYLIATAGGALILLLLVGGYIAVRRYIRPK